MRYGPPIALCLMIATSAVAEPASQAPTRRAFDLPDKPGLDCMKAGLWNHAAYVPGQIDRTQRCSHLLSTDTLVTVHRWDRT